LGGGRGVAQARSVRPQGVSALILSLHRRHVVAQIRSRVLCGLSQGLLYQSFDILALLHGALRRADLVGAGSDTRRDRVARRFHSLIRLRACFVHAFVDPRIVRFTARRIALRL
jgi:hypothetical protein